MPQYNNYLNYCSIYSAKINNSIYRKSCTRDVCFGSSLSRCVKQQNQVEYTIVLVRSPKLVNDQNYNNYCWMSKHQLENYLRRIRSIKTFNYSVKESSWNYYACYKINLKMTGSKKEITFVLQSIKRTYEFPYNYYLFEAYKMQELPAFKFDSILNLFDVAWVSHYGTAYNSGHSYSGNSKFVKYKELREKLPHTAYVTDLFKPNTEETDLVTKQLGMHPTYRILKDSNKWTDESFQKFLPVYIKNYNVLKQ